MCSDVKVEPFPSKHTQPELPNPGGLGCYWEQPRQGKSGTGPSNCCKNLGLLDPPAVYRSAHDIPSILRILGPSWMDIGFQVLTGAHMLWCFEVCTCKDVYGTTGELCMKGACGGSRDMLRGFV